MIKEITNINQTDLKLIFFDFAIFSCGTEKRCHYTFKNLIDNVTNTSFVFEFSNSRTRNSHIENRKVFKLREYDLKVNFVIVKNNDDRIIFKILQKAINSSIKDKIKIYLDYSSMPRKWYQAILTLLNDFINVDVDLIINYSAYDYNGDNFPTINVNSLSASNMHYGNIQPNKPKLLFLGLGFDKYAAKALLERIEALHILFYTNPSYLVSQTLNIETVNEKILSNSNKTFLLPITDMKKSFEALENMYLKYCKEYSLIIASLGPKPMVMLSNLLSLKYKDIQNLRLNSIYHYRSHKDQNVLKDTYPVKICFEKST